MNEDDPDRLALWGRCQHTAAVLLVQLGDLTAEESLAVSDASITGTKAVDVEAVRAELGFLGMALTQMLCKAGGGAPTLFDYDTGQYLRKATGAELVRSLEAAKLDGGVGMIMVDDQGDRRCYVSE